METFALVLTLCMSNSECNETTPETYTSFVHCAYEANLLILQGLPKEMVHCEKYEDG